MDGITELLRSRKAKAIEDRKRNKGKESDASDTTSSDDEESVREMICKKAKEKKKKLKELIGRKKVAKQRKIKEPVGIGAELRRNKPP